MWLGPVPRRGIRVRDQHLASLSEIERERRRLLRDPEVRKVYAGSGTAGIFVALKLLPYWKLTFEVSSSPKPEKPPRVKIAEFLISGVARPHRRSNTPDDPPPQW